jgi:hypothetical protein
MATLEQRPVLVGEDSVFEWRLEALKRAGFSLREAWLLAAAKQVDVRAAERLLQRGCPSETALRILL